MVFQSYALFPHMSVAENVGYGLRAAGVHAAKLGERVHTMLELVRLDDAGNRSVIELSGGQQQRVALARALVNEPRVLLLDEPLGALDLQLRKQLQDELQAIQRRLGTTFIYVTHDQEEALTLSHRIALIEAGRVVQVGEPRDLYERPVNRFVAGFVGESTLLSCEFLEFTHGRAKVRLETGRQASLGHYGDAVLSRGERVCAMVRPEDLEVSTPETAQFIGDVQHTVYLGTHCRHDVTIARDTVVRVKTSVADGVGLRRAALRIKDNCGVILKKSADDASGH